MRDEMISAGVQNLNEVLAQVMACLGSEARDPDAALPAEDAEVMTLLTELRRLGWCIRQDVVLGANTPRVLAEALMAQGNGLAPRREWPASPSQEQLWLLDRIDCLGALYNVAWLARVEGPMDVEVMHSAVEYLVRRHASLRTRFAERDDTVLQIVEDEVTPDIEFFDATDATIDAALLARAERAMSLARGPLFRFHIARLGPCSYRVLAVTHHIVTDGWSADLFARELFDTYAALAEGREPQLPDMSISYGEYADWAQLRLNAPQADKLGAYWQQALQDVPQVLDLPTDHARPARQSYRGRTIPFTLTPQLSEALRDLARRQDATLYMLLMASLSVVLAKWSGQTRFSLGTPVAGREDARLDPVIGFFVNSVVMPQEVRDGESFADLLLRVRNTALGAYRNSGLPFPKLVSLLRPERDLSRHPSFQVWFALQPAEPPLAIPGLDVTSHEIPTRTSKFDLSFELVDTPGALTGSLEYADTLWDEASMSRILRHWATVLETVCRSPGLTMGEILLSDAEEMRQLAVLSEGAASPDSPESVCDMFEAQVARTPDAISLRDGERTLTYAQLNRQVQHLAAALRSRGYGAGDRIGVSLPSSDHAVVAFLAVLRARCCFLPLDPDLPETRFETMVSLAKPRCILGTAAHLTGKAKGAVVLDVDEVLATSPARLDHPGPELAGQTACILFTSGSTGTPKGVMLGHQALARKVRDAQTLFEVSEHMRYGVFSSIGFDPFLTQVLVPLTSGACAVILRDTLRMRPASFWAEAARTGLNVLDTTPTVIKHLLQERPTDAPALSVLLLGGEVLAPELANRLQVERVAHRICNLYGPTEAGIEASFHFLPEAEQHRTDPIPIGRPLPGYGLHVLDPNGNPKPIGAIGEIYISGPCLAEGYLDRESQTRAQFRDIPWMGRTRRMYRTGDLGRWNTDGALVFAGRIDDQAKIGGLRVEPAEVEAAILATGLAEEAAVILRNDSGPPRLVAYLRSAAIDESLLRERLSAMLVPGMIPSCFVALDSFPQTANGKLDMRALPDPGDGPARHVAPTTDTERLLAGLFGALLEIENPSADASFFALGGNSLTATRLVMLLAERHGLQLAVRDLFEAPTVQGLARRTRKAQHGVDMLATVLPLRDEGATSLFCLPPITGLSWSYAALAPHLPDDIRLIGLQSPGLDSQASVPGTVEELAQAHCRYIRQAQPTGPYHILGWSFGGVLAQAVAALLEAAGESVALLAILDGAPADESHRLARLETEQDEAREWLVSVGLSPERAAAVRGWTDTRHVLRLARHPLADYSDETLAHLAEVFRANETAFLSYRPEHGSQAPMLFFPAMAELGSAPLSRDNWGGLVKGAFHSVPLNHRHHALMSPQAAAEVAVALRPYLVSAKGV